MPTLPSGGMRRRRKSRPLTCRDREKLNREIQEINEATLEEERFISDPDGIVATALDLRTYTESKDTDSVRELVKILIERVEVYQDYGEIRAIAS